MPAISNAAPATFVCWRANQKLRHSQAKPKTHTQFCFPSTTFEKQQERYSLFCFLLKKKYYCFYFIFFFKERKKWRRRFPWPDDGVGQPTVLKKKKKQYQRVESYIRMHTHIYTYICEHLLCTVGCFSIIKNRTRSRRPIQFSFFLFFFCREVERDK